MGQYRGLASLSLRMLRFHSTLLSLTFLFSPYKPKYRHLCTSHPGTYVHRNTQRATSCASTCKKEMGKHMHSLHPTHRQAAMHTYHRHLHAHKRRYTHLHACTHPHSAHKYRNTHARLKTAHVYGNLDTCEQNRCPVLPAPPFRAGGRDFLPNPVLLRSPLEPSSGEVGNRLPGPPWP